MVAFSGDAIEEVPLTPLDNEKSKTEIIYEIDRLETKGDGTCLGAAVLQGLLVRHR
jgi:hypothetical protein